jgi:hypothetical protein
MIRLIACALFMIPLASCLAVGVASTAIGVTGAVVGTTVKATGAVVGAVVPHGDDKDHRHHDS